MQRSAGCLKKRRIREAISSQRVRAPAAELSQRTRARTPASSGMCVRVATAVRAENIVPQQTILRHGMCWNEQLSTEERYGAIEPLVVIAT